MEPYRDDPAATAMQSLPYVVQGESLRGDLKPMKIEAQLDHGSKSCCSLKRTMLIFLSLGIMIFFGYATNQYIVEHKNVSPNNMKKRTSKPSIRQSPTPIISSEKLKPGKKPVLPKKKPTNSPTRSKKPRTKAPTLSPTPETSKVSVESGKKEANGVLNMLHKYYGDTNILQNTVYLQHEDSRYKTNLEYISKKMARAIVHKGSFVIGAMGSSVTAGHDNCNYDSYERQLERLISPVFEAAGVKLEVRNAGEGGGCGDDYANQIWCSRHMVGDDADIIHYSWTYFEAGGHNLEAIHEQIIRWALLMKNSPAVHFLNVGELFDPEACLRGAIGSHSLFSKYVSFGLNAVCLQTGLTMSKKWGGKKWNFVGDGLHSTTRYGEDEKDQFRKDSLGVVFRNWHPGPLGFQVVADAFAHYYLHAFLHALELIKNVQDNRGDLAKEFPATPKLLSKSRIPRPLVCDPAICDAEDPPGCHNFEEPTYGRPQIYVLDPKDSMNPYKEFAKDTDSGWDHWVAGKSTLIPRDDMDREECQHFDKCGAMKPNTDDAGWITFVLPRMSLGKIIVCCCCGKECVDEVFTKSQAQFMFDGTVLDSKTFKKYPNGKCLEVQNRFNGPVTDTNGHLHLGVKMSKKPNGGISHVIAM